MKMEKKRNGIIRRSREERISCGGKKQERLQQHRRKQGRYQNLAGYL
ncbi:hypothetical protein [Anaerostipes sp.]